MLTEDSWCSTHPAAGRPPRSLWPRLTSAVTAPLRLYPAGTDANPFRHGRRFDRYRLQGRLGEGGFATVYSAYDDVERCRVAIKIPDARYVVNTQSLDDLQRETDIMASLRHPAILPLKDARVIDGHFLMVFPLGRETLAERMMRRMSRSTAMTMIHQMVAAVAHAHRHQVLHRDIKPENFILFDDNEIRLTDFGLARIQLGRFDDSASGTLGYIAPEQAMGKPGYHSDVFALGLILYRMLSGELPEYPFQSPLPGYNKLRRGVSRDFVALIRKAIDPAPSKRFRTAAAMETAMKKIAAPLSAKGDLERFRVTVRRHQLRAA